MSEWVEARPRKLTVTGRPGREVWPPEWSRKQEARIKRSGDRETINNCGLLTRRSFLSRCPRWYQDRLSFRGLVLSLDDSDSLVWRGMNVCSNSFSPSLL